MVKSTYKRRHHHSIVVRWHHWHVSHVKRHWTHRRWLDSWPHCHVRWQRAVKWRVVWVGHHVRLLLQVVSSRGTGYGDRNWSSRLGRWLWMIIWHIFWHSWLPATFPPACHICHTHVIMTTMLVIWPHHRSFNKTTTTTIQPIYSA